MNLHQTKALMDAKLTDKCFDAYIVLVGLDGKRTCLCSPNADMNTYFDAASMGKVLVTSTLILQAYSEGQLALDDTLDKFFLNVPEEKKNITVKQLLTHTSGIVRKQFSREVADRGGDAIAAFILSVPLAFAPGSSYQYSCSGYVLLGLILEKLYKMPLDKLFYTHLKPQLDLTHAKFNIAVDEPNAIDCFKREHVGEYRADDEIVYAMRGIGGNGASFWTAADIERFIEAVLEKNSALYPEKYFALAEHDYTPDFEVGQGLGYQMVDARYSQTGKLFPDGSFGHCGHTGTSFFINREKRMYAIILTNATRCLNRKGGFRGYDYGIVMKMREDIHNAIADDLSAQGLL